MLIFTEGGKPEDPEKNPRGKGENNTSNKLKLTYGPCPGIEPGPQRSVSELLNIELDLTAVNGTKLPFIDWAEVRVRLPSASGKAKEIHVPFLITEEPLKKPILGYNVIEELTRIDFSFTPTDIVDSVTAGFVDSEEEKLSTLVNLIRAPSEEYLCPIKSPKKGIRIPAGGTVQLSCRANTGRIHKDSPVLFEPDEMPQWSDGLEVLESVTSLKKGYVSRVAVEVHNTTVHGIVLRNRTPLGRLQLVRSVTPVEANLKELIEESTDKEAGQTCKRNGDHTIRSRDTFGNTDYTPDVDLSELTEEQK
ncbi:hypothetical protein AC249_AIPGENE26963 [Exaiptasia diaphana]|nr:hypothetical protein AC249_AIPGENE26963 [Exaiptasia diaphana]